MLAPPLVPGRDDVPPLVPGRVSRGPELAIACSYEGGGSSRFDMVTNVC